MKKTYKLHDLCCANCAAKIENNLNKLPEITRATINFMTQKLILEVEDGCGEEALLDKVEKVIHKVEPDCTLERK